MHSVLFAVAMHPKGAAGGRSCRLPCIRRELPVAGPVGDEAFTGIFAEGGAYLSPKHCRAGRPLRFG